MPIVPRLFVNAALTVVRMGKVASVYRTIKSSAQRHKLWLSVMLQLRMHPGLKRN
jgi:hypothetical protein